MIIYGINPTIEALRAGSVSEVWAKVNAGRRVAELVGRASQEGIVVHRVDAGELERLAPGSVHQGIVAQVSPSRRCSIQDLLQEATEAPLILVLDGIEDPRNFGALARAAEAAGVNGVVYQSRRSASLGATAAKASAGALAYLRLEGIRWCPRLFEACVGGQHQSGPRGAQERRRLDGRAGRRCRTLLLQPRFDRAHGVRRRRRRTRVTTSRA